MKPLKRLLYIILFIPGALLTMFSVMIPIIPAILWIIYGGQFEDYHLNGKVNSGYGVFTPMRNFYEWSKQ